MKTYWALFADEARLPEHTVNKILDICNKYDLGNAQIGEGEEVTSIRSSRVSFVDCITEPFIHKVTDYYLEQANKKCFGFDISGGLDSVQFTNYDKEYEGHYDWHPDMFVPSKTAYTRKLSIIIQLSDPKDYEGGNLLFRDNLKLPDASKMRQRGAIIVFPSFLDHKVTKVVEGHRQSLVGWIEGPSWR